MKTNNNVNLPLQQINLVGMDYSFEGNTVAFDTNGKIMVNATQMARPFNKKTAHWLNLQSTKEFIRELSVLRNINTADLLKVTQGGEPGKQGTWLHEDLAIEFARWLSPRFAIWCNDVIKTIIRQKATLSNDEIIQRITDGRIKLGLDDIKSLEGKMGGKYMLKPADYLKHINLWDFTTFHIGNIEHNILTATLPDSTVWYLLPHVLKAVGLNEKDAAGFALNFGYDDCRLILPYNKGYKRYFISRKAVETFGFNTENRITITKHYYRNLLVGPLFESKMMNLINKAETMDEKEFLVDIYKAFK